MKSFTKLTSIFFALSLSTSVLASDDIDENKKIVEGESIGDISLGMPLDEAKKLAEGTRREVAGTNGKVESITIRGGAITSRGLSSLDGDTFNIYYPKLVELYPEARIYTPHFGQTNLEAPSLGYDLKWYVECNNSCKRSYTHIVYNPKDK